MGFIAFWQRLYQLKTALWQQCKWPNTIKLWTGALSNADGSCRFTWQLPAGSLFLYTIIKNADLRHSGYWSFSKTEISCVFIKTSHIFVPFTNTLFSSFWKHIQLPPSYFLPSFKFIKAALCEQFVRSKATLELQKQYLTKFLLAVIWH